MDIVGVEHNNRYLDGIGDWLLESFPSAKSVMLEIPPTTRVSESDFRANHDFFLLLEERLTKNGLRSIRGDIAYWEPSQKFFDKIEQIDSKFKYWEESGKFPISLFINYIELLPVYARLHYHNAISRARDRAMVRVAKEECPDLIVVGRAHANYLKNRIPNSKYTAICSNSVYNLSIGSRAFAWLSMSRSILPVKADVMLTYDEL